MINHEVVQSKHLRCDALLYYIYLFSFDLLTTAN